MKRVLKLTLSIVFALVAVASYGQCDLQVEIKANPGTDLCLGESVQITAVTNQEVEIPENCGPAATVGCVDGSIPFTATLGGGTNINAQGNSLPDVFGDVNEGQIRSQIIYRAEEIIAQGFEGGKINGMEMELATILSNGQIPNLEIKMACVSDQEFNGGFYTGALTTVFNNKSYTLGTGYNTFNFDQAYDWNGQDNILIEVCVYVQSGQAGNIKAYTKDQTLAYPAVRVARKILSDGTCAFTDNARNSNQRPNTKFLACKPQLKDFTYSWTPTNDLSDPSARDPFANPTADQTYTVSVFETANPGCVATDNITIKVIDPGNFTPSANTPLCEGDALVLSSNTAADGYLWLGPDGFTSTSANPIINNVGQNNEGTYQVFVDVGFCKASKTIDVDVESLLSSGQVLPDPVLCNNNDQFNLFSLLSAYDQNATSQWTDNNGSGVLNGSIIRPSDIPDNQLPQTFTYTYSLSNTCGTQSSTVSVTINPAPKAGDDGNTIVCNKDSTFIDLNNLLQGNPDGGGTWRDASNTGLLSPQGTVNFFEYNPGTYTFYYKVVGPGACKADSAKVDVTVKDFKVAGNGGSTRICKGTAIGLEDYLSDHDPNGVWLDTDNSGGLVSATTGVFNSANVAPGSYTFTYFVDNEDPCPDQSTTVEVEITKKPEIVNANTFCNASETFYQVTFEVRDGDPNTLDASVIADGITYGFNLTQQGGLWIFTSDPIPEGEEVEITIWDADNCGTSSYSIRKRCGCATDAGVINVSQIEDICEGSFYTINYIGGFIDDGDDIFEFILHDGPGTTIGTIYDRNRTGTFGFVPGLVEGQTYYVSVIAGDKIPNKNEVDLNDDCLDVRAGQPIRFIRLPQPDLTITPDTACIGANVNVKASNIAGPGVSFEWTGPGVSSPNLEFDILGLAPENVGTYNFIVNKSICRDTFQVDLAAFPVPQVNVPTNFTACANVLDSIPLNLGNVQEGSARFQTGTFQIIDLPIVAGENYLRRTFNDSETLILKEISYPEGCTMVMNKQINVTLEEAPGLSFELISPDIICSDNQATADIRFNLNPANASGKIIFEVNGFQFPEEPQISNDSVITVNAISGGQNTFKIRKYISLPKTCSYAIDFGTADFYNFQEPQVSFDVNNNKICRGDTAYIPVFVNSSDSLVVEYSINGAKKSFVTDRDTLLPVKEDLDFLFSIDSAYYAGGSGCGKLIGLSQTIEVKDPINFNISPVKNDCKGESNGSIILSADGENTTFSLDGSTFFTRTSFNNLPSGTYTVFAKAESGCVSVRSATIENKSNLEIGVDIDPTTCGNINGTLKVTADLGNEPYHVIVNGNEVQNGQLLENLNPGVYQIYAYDNLTCEVRDTVIIDDSEGVDFAFSENGPLRCDFPDAGKIVVTPNGGSGNYVYQLNNLQPQTDSIFAGLYAQFYNVKVIDTLDGCTKEKRIRIKPEVPFFFNAKILRGLNCSYSKDGRVQALAENNGTTYLFSLDGINYSSQDVFTKVGAGQFTLFAKELDGCRREQDFGFKMEAPAPIVSEVIYTEDVECWNGKEGVVALSASGGNGDPFSFKTATTSGFKSSPVFSNLGQGTHEFVVQDLKKCTDTIRVKINGPDTTVISVTKLDSANGKLTIRINATNTFLQTFYSIDGGNNFNTNNIFSGLEPGTYNIVVKDQKGCETVYTLNLTLVGINETVALEQEYKVYPNPFENELYIEWTNPGFDKDQVYLYDMGGRVIHFDTEKSNQRLSIRSNNPLKPGVYILKIGNQTHRVIKQ
ncbi:T9SS type A sorting domain-containing protein [Luteibaculum oceani]|uniref:T9SS type A sorting domain-containing protein n=1 Tax=Luteibaculum oceani TaxID=1294296 RepID=A0A5C6V8V7_9FLAO|nr:T9SS type A sorting domain-containing protein [Luteibaculum oceani]TXC81497.1 T9SS type A sorting domain-containing protein [Luteibaculum oceani]